MGAVFITQQDRQAGLLRRVAFEQRPAGGASPRPGTLTHRRLGRAPLRGVLRVKPGIPVKSVPAQPFPWGDVLTWSLSLESGQVHACCLQESASGAPLQEPVCYLGPWVLYLDSLGKLRLVHGLEPANSGSQNGRATAGCRGGGGLAGVSELSRGSLRATEAEQKWLGSPLISKVSHPGSSGSHAMSPGSALQSPL